MFKCDKCKKISEPGEKQTRIPTGRREVEYPERYELNERGEKKIIDFGGVGWEITGEIALCPRCAERLDK